MQVVSWGRVRPAAKRRVCGDHLFTSLRDVWVHTPHHHQAPSLLRSSSSPSSGPPPPPSSGPPPPPPQLHLRSSSLSLLRSSSSPASGPPPPPLPQVLLLLLLRSSSSSSHDRALRRRTRYVSQASSKKKKHILNEYISKFQSRNKVKKKCLKTSTNIKLIYQKKAGIMEGKKIQINFRMNSIYSGYMMPWNTHIGYIQLVIYILLMNDVIIRKGISGKERERESGGRLRRGVGRRQGGGLALAGQEEMAGGGRWHCASLTDTQHTLPQGFSCIPSCFCSLLSPVCVCLCVFTS